LQNADCILIQGSNMAECHPVGFQWVMEAKRRGATIIHVDPRFTRTSAVADIHVPIRAGSDIVFLGAVIHYILENERYFRDYVVNYTNAPAIITDEFLDTEDLDGLFSGWDTEKCQYDPKSWQYKDVKSGPGGGLARDFHRRAEVRTGRASGGEAYGPDASESEMRVSDPETALLAVHAGHGGADVRRAPGEERGLNHG
jgi:formate dehydrogenase major subunit